MVKAFSTKIFLCLSFLFGLEIQAEEIRDYYSEPGINPFKETINQNFNESIDPFSGTLQLSYVDIFVPGNGGMNISVNRVYTSLQTNMYPNRSTNGVGWTMHFGRIVTSRSNVDKICNQHLWSVSTKDNPSLEHSDGSREILALNSIQNDNSLITKTNWRAECLPGSTGFIVTSPDGTKYTMDTFDNYQEEPSWLTTRIEDVYGNWISVEYGVTSGAEHYITKVFRSEEGSSNPVLTYTYDDGSGEYETPRLISIEANGQTWEYVYEDIPGFLFPRHQLKKVIRPDGKEWEYKYYDKTDDSDPDDGVNEDGLGSFSLRQVTYPDGAQIDYTYQFIQFEKGSSFRTTSIKTKTVSGSDLQDGTTTYTFNPYSAPKTFDNGVSFNLDETIVVTPTSKYVYHHFGKDYHQPSIGVYAFIKPSSVGLLRSKKTYDLNDTLKEVTVNFWGYRKISDENYYHGGSRSWWIEEETYAPMLLSRYVGQDSYADEDEESASSRVEYSNFDEYGNPQTISELVNYGGTENKITNRTYIHDTTNWILNLPATETISYQSELYESSWVYFPGTLSVSEESKRGVLTKFTYTSDGDLASVEDALGNVTEYSNYKRGIAQQEIWPESVSISREIYDTGSLKSETNGRSQTTHYEYDNLNRLVRIDFPTNSPVLINYGLKERTLTRGNYQQVDNYDGLGRKTKITRKDLDINESITQETEYDASGRVVFESYPNSQDGISYEYDTLNRVTKKIFPDSSYIETSYNDHIITETDERKNSTVYRFRSVGNSNRSVVEIHQPESVSTVIYRNSLGQIIKVGQGELQGDNSIQGYVREFEYDSHSFLLGQSDPEIGYTHFGRDAIGNLIWSRVEDSAQTTYHYDDLNQIQLIDYPDGTPDTHFEYDGNGNISSLISGLTQWSYVYDENDNLKQEALIVDGFLPRNYALNYTYSSVDALSSITYPDGFSVDYEVNAFGRPTKVGNFATEVTYHPSGQIHSFTLGSGLQSTRTLNTRLFPESIVTGDLLSLAYSYDPAGNITSIIDTINSSENVYMLDQGSYDGLNRLTSATGAWGGAAIQYDHRGNILSKRIGIEQFDYAYSYERLWSMKEVLTSINSLFYTFKYDTYGNVSSKSEFSHDGGRLNLIGSKKFKYDDALRLIQSKVDEESTTYIYDGQGNKVLEYVDGTYNYNFSLYSSSGQLFYEENTYKCESTSYVRLGTQLIAKSKNQTSNSSLDTDNDTINDCLEEQLGLNPGSNSDADLDPDNDGLTNAEEISIGLKINTDDSDGDGITDGDEMNEGTNPHVVDTDGDGLSDLEENSYAGLNPLLFDTDHDGVNDSWEIALGTNPLISDDRISDFDGDGFSNRQESLAGSDPIVSSASPSKGSLILSYQTGASIEGGVALDASGISYVASGDDTLYAVHPDGSLKWSYNTESILSASPTVASDGTIYLASLGNKLFAINPDGSLKWHKYISEGVNSSPAVDDAGNIYIGTRNGTVYSLNSEGATNWSYATDNAINGSSPSIALDGTIYIGSEDGHLYAFSSKGELKWRYWVGYAINGTPAIGIGGIVYITANDGYLYAITSQGSRKWSLRVDSSINQRSRSPVIDKDGIIYVGAYEGSLQAIHPDGHLLWRSEPGSSTYTPAIAANGTIYSVDYSGVLSVFDKYGSLIWFKDTGLSISSSPNLDIDGTIYLTSINGEVLALADNSGGAEDAPWPLYQHDATGSGYLCRTISGVDLDDTDNDGIPNCFEIANGLDLNDSSDAQIDSDSDGLINLEEYQSGSNFFLADSDGDGLNDGDEVNIYTSDPSRFDTDRDGLGDAFEVSHGFNPNSSSEGLIDSDNDGFSNRQEAFSGSDPLDPMSEPNPGDVAWKLDFNGSNFKGQATIDDAGMIYVGIGYSLYSLYPNGELRWSYYTGGGISSAPALSSDGTVYVGTTNDKVYAINNNGTLKWSFTTGGDVVESPAIGNDGSLYFGSTDGYIYALNPETGQQLWSFETGHQVRGAVAISQDEVIIAGSMDSNIYAINSDGSSKWVYVTEGPVSSSAAIGKDGTIYIGSNDTYLHAITPNGSPRWRFKTGDYIHSSPVIGSDGTIYIGDDQLYAINFDGSARWSVPVEIDDAPLIAQDGTIYVNQTSGAVKAFDVNGNERWSFNSAYSIYTSLAIAKDGTLYFGAHTDGLYAVIDRSGGLADSSWPKQGHDSQSVSNHCYRSGLFYGDDDSDSDGIPDCAELVLGLNPEDSNDGLDDTDSDGLTSSEEYFLGTDPMNGDSDGDLLTDGDEVNIHNSSPLNSDSDHDGLPDFYEVHNNLNPSDDKDSNFDSDGDGFSNRQEVLLGLDAFNTVSSPDNGTLLWTFQTGLYIYSTPAIAEDGTVYFGSSDDRIYAIYPNGSLKWSYLTGGDVKSSPSIGADGTIYIASGDGYLYALNQDGTLKWQGDIRDGYFTYTSGSTAIGSDGTIYVAGTTNLHAFNPDGTKEWSRQINYQVNSDIDSSPAIGPDGTIYVGSDSTVRGGKNSKASLNAIRPSNGYFDWHYQVGGDDMKSSPAIASDGTIYLGGTHDDIVSMHPDGSKNWSLDLGGDVSSPTIGNNGTIYVSTRGGGLHAISPQGSILWTYVANSIWSLAPVISSDGTIFVGSSDDTLHAVNVDGSERWVFATGDSISTSPVIGHDGAVYFGTYDGKLYAVASDAGTLADTTWPAFLMNHRHTANVSNLDMSFPPVVSISSPAENTVFNISESVGLIATASDIEDGDLSSNITWSSSVNGTLGGGGSMEISSLSAGSHIITASVDDGDGHSSAVTRSIRINAYPVISIDNSMEGNEFSSDELITLSSIATDTEDGDLSAHVVWSSDRDGLLGTEGSIQISLSAGSHVLTASVADADNAVATDTVSITVTDSGSIRDSDGDGIPDAWETLHEMNPSDASDRYLDSDGDGVNNYLEYLQSTNPTDALDTPTHRYYVLNPVQVGKSISVMSLVDSNNVSAGATNFALNALQVGQVPGIEVAQSLLIEAVGAISIGSATDATDMPLPSVFAGSEFVIPHSRSSHYYFVLSLTGNANVEIDYGPVSVNEIALQGQVLTIDAGSTNGRSTTIRSDMPILIMHGGNNHISQDVYPVPPAALEIYGGRRGAVIGALEDNTTVTAYSSAGTSEVINLNANGYATISMGNSSLNGADDVIRLVADKPIAAVQVADGDGYESAAYLDRIYWGNRYGIPVDSQYAKVICSINTTVILFNGTDQPEAQSCDSDGIHPGKAFFGNTTSGVHIQSGAYLISEQPIFVVYETAASEDEHNLLGGNVAIGNHIPMIHLNTPSDGAFYNAGDIVTFSATATDAEDGDLSDLIDWQSDLEGNIGSGANLSTNLSMAGLHTVTARVTDLSGVWNQALFTLQINGGPSLTITQPTEPSTVYDSQPLTLAASASDPEEGDLSDLIQWASDIDGSLGGGASMSTTLTPGMHTVTATVFDSNSLSGSDEIGVIVLHSSGDADGDGMPDSWENTYGLNPSDTADQVTDLDYDGYSNYLEYLGNTNPADNSSIPATRYVILNPLQAGKSLQVVSYEDGNVITAGGTILNLNQYERGSIPGADVTQGQIIEGNKGFAIGSDALATDMPASWLFAGTKFVIPHQRDNHFYFFYGLDSDANVDVNDGSGLTSLSVPSGQVIKYAAGSTNGIAAIIHSDNPILVVHGGSHGNKINRDVYPVPPAARELWGPRRGGHIGALEDNTTVEVYTSGGHFQTLHLNAGEMVEPTVGNTGTEGTDDVIRLVADKPIAAIEHADSDGVESAAYWEKAFFNHLYALPVNAQYLEVICYSTTEITLNDGVNPPNVKSCVSDGIYPGKAYFGSTTDGINISAGAYLTSEQPVYLMYEASSRDAERNLLGHGVSQ